MADETSQGLSQDVDVFFVLAGAFMVLFMQIGFTMLAVGSVQSNNTPTVLIKSAMDACISAVCWFTLGHDLAFGSSPDNMGMLPGVTGFFSAAESLQSMDYAFHLFQWALVASTTAIFSRAVSERVNLNSHIALVLFHVLVTYTMVVKWTWSDDGFLSRTRDEPLFGCGVVDFAGGGVVHMTGSVASLIGIIILGPRACVSFRDGRVHAPPGQSDTFRALGTLAVWLGWLGFNGCSMGKLIGYSGVAARAMVVTVVSATTSGIVGTIVSVWLSSTESAKGGLGNRLWWRKNRVSNGFVLPSLSDRKSGGTGMAQIRLTPTLGSILAGLVGITASCGLVDLFGAFAIGVGSAVCYISASRLLAKIGVDDSLDVVSVHLAAGMWGMVAVGLFATQDAQAAAYGPGRAARCAGVFYGGDGRQLGANFVFVMVNLGWTTLASGSLLYVLYRYDMLHIPQVVKETDLDLFIHKDVVASISYGEEGALDMTLGGSAESISRRRPASPNGALKIESELSATIWGSLGLSSVLHSGSVKGISWADSNDATAVSHFASLNMDKLSSNSATSVTHFTSLNLETLGSNGTTTVPRFASINLESFGREEANISAMTTRGSTANSNINSSVVGGNRAPLGNKVIQPLPSLVELPSSPTATDDEHKTDSPPRPVMSVLLEDLEEDLELALREYPVVARNKLTEQQPTIAFSPPKASPNAALDNGDFNF